MENASKALMIAGGVLIALIIITMFLLMFNGISNIEKEQAEQTKTAQLSAFNAEYEAYNKRIMYGVDVITLINKIAENNKKHFGSEDYQITITVNNIEMTDSSTIAGSEQEKYLYKCNKISYNQAGRVSRIEIVDY